ncbi:hypothetical protein RRG08_043857 [Elysia crispata]|uniref:Uncharacterized protein n=1 Tax=Elysia crispata TaxID=231223 RepID=A0AAE0XUF9_9GAST|nr:hypothetical protein RRG08_043857 [Elysia crispata]
MVLDAFPFESYSQDASESVRRKDEYFHDCPEVGARTDAKSPLAVIVRRRLSSSSPVELCSVYWGTGYLGGECFICGKDAPDEISLQVTPEMSCECGKDAATQTRNKGEKIALMRGTMRLRQFERFSQADTQPSRQQNGMARDGECQSSFTIIPG